MDKTLLNRETELKGKSTQRTDILQLAKVMGNQAIVQRLLIGQVCTQGFILKHITGEIGGGTIVNEETVISDYEDWVSRKYSTYKDPDWIGYVLFIGKSGNVYGVKDRLINHYAGVKSVKFESAQSTSYVPG